MELEKRDAAKVDDRLSTISNAKKTALPAARDSMPTVARRSVLPDTVETQEMSKKKKKQKATLRKKKKQASHQAKFEHQQQNMGKSNSLLGNFSWSLFYQPLIYYWFQQVIFRNSVYEPRMFPRLFSVLDMICIPFYGVNPSRETIETRFGRKKEKLWFHGTTSFQSAYSILNEGIKVSLGRRRNDFSVNEGFYVSDDFDAARCWGKRNNGCGHAVLVFRCREQSLSNCFLDLNRYNNLWKKVVRFHRSSFEKEVDLKAGISQVFMGRINSATLKNLQFNEIDFIKGPICYDVPKILDDNCTERPILMTNSSGKVIQQLCIRTQNYARVFGSLANICAVIWFLPGP